MNFDALAWAGLRLSACASALGLTIGLPMIEGAHWITWLAPIGWAAATAPAWRAYDRVLHPPKV